MYYDLDFIAVGEKSKSGDAIAFRFGPVPGKNSNQFVMVVDGGTLDSGQELVDHITNHYGSNSVDLVVSTHPDADHSSGLSVVLEQLQVDCLWMHQPWNHSPDIRHLFHDGRITDASLEDYIREAIENAHDLETIARRRRIPIFEPFSNIDMGIPGVTVLGPSQEFYQGLLPHFRDTPKAKEELGAFESILKAAGEVVTRIAESFDYETLTDPTEESNWRSAENNSSVILHLQLDEENAILLTSDAAVHFVYANWALHG